MKTAHIRKIFALLLVGVMIFCCASLSAFAVEEDGSDSSLVGSLAIEVPSPVEASRNLSGYASKFVSSSGQGSFTVPVTGSAIWSAGLTFKTSCDESSEAITVVTIQRPEGGYILQNVTFSANQERYFTFYLPTSGTYTVYYSAYVPNGATSQMQCWIY